MPFARRTPRPDAPFTLTVLERAIVRLRAEGLTRRQIAERLGLTVKGVETRITMIRSKQETAP